MTMMEETLVNYVHKFADHRTYYVAEL